MPFDLESDLKKKKKFQTSFPKPSTIERMLYEDSILKFADNYEFARSEYDALNELTGNDDESEEEEKPKKKSKSKSKKKNEEENDEKDKENNIENNNDNASKKPKKQLLEPIRAFHRVKWNTNYSACMWIAYAGKAGLLRCQSIDWVV